MTRAARSQAAVWTPTPETLGRFGLVAYGQVQGEPAGSCEAVLPLGQERVLATEMWVREHGVEERAALVGLTPAELALEPQQAGDVLLVLWADCVGGLDEARTRLGTIIVQLHEANFLRSACLVGPEGVLTTAFALASSPAVRVQLDRRDWGELKREVAFAAQEAHLAVLATCASKGHLAMANFVERRTGLRVEAIGRSVARAGVGSEIG